MMKVSGSNGESSACSAHRGSTSPTWGEFFHALLLTSDQRAKALTAAIADLAGGRIADCGLIAAAGIIASLPPAIIGFGPLKALISGLTTGGVKG